MLKHLPVFLVLFQLITAIIIPLIHSLKKQLTPVVVLSGGLINILLSILCLYRALEAGPLFYYPGGWEAHLGIAIILDPIAGLMVTLFSVIFFIILCYIVGVGRDESWYYCLFFLLCASMSGIVMAFDIFNLFVFMEISLITSVALIAIKNTASAIDGAFKYLIINAIGSGCILLGIGMLYQITGFLNLGWIASMIDRALILYPHVLTGVLGLFVVGFGIKMAIFPLHVWLPDAYSAAPVPTSALLSSLVTKIYGIAFFRIIYIVFFPGISHVVPLGSILKIMAALAILLGSFFAITQVDLMRMLAYSSVAQIGYIVLGFSLFTGSGLKGAFLHIINYAFMKSTMFLAAGNIIRSTGRRDIKNLDGLGSKMPVTFTAFTIAALAMIGIPPLNGFFSKWYLVLGSLEANEPVLVVIIILSSLLNAAYYLPVIVRAYFYKPAAGEEFKVKVVEPKMYIPVVILGLSCILLGLGVNWPLKVINRSVTLLMGG